MPRTPPTITFRSCTGTPPSRWPGSMRRAPPGWRRRSQIPLIQEFMARRIGAIGTPESMALLVDELGRAAAVRRAFVALDRDRGIAARPAPGCHARRLARVFSQQLAADPDRRVRSRAMALGAHLRRPGRAGGVAARPRRRQGRPRLAARGARGVAPGEGPVACRHLARAWCATPASAVSPSGRCRLTTIRRRRTLLIKAYTSLGPIRAARRLEHAGCPQGLGPGPARRRRGRQTAARRSDGRPGAPAPQLERP